MRTSKRSFITRWTNFNVTLMPWSKKVAACAKHYVGDGGTYMGINGNNTIIDTHGLMSIHMPAYYNSIIRGVSTIMISYNSWNGEKMHANHFLVTDFLKNKLKFRVSCLWKSKIFSSYLFLLVILRDTDAINFMGFCANRALWFQTGKALIGLLPPNTWTILIQLRLELVLVLTW